MEEWRNKKRPNLLVEAVRLTEDNAAEVSVLCGGELIEEIDPEHPQEMQPGINIETPDGRRRASLHMYVVRYGNQFFVSHNRQFELAYEPVNREAPPMESAGDTRKRLGFGEDPSAGMRI